MKFMLFIMEALMFNRPCGGPRVRLCVEHWLKQKSGSNGTRIRLVFTSGWRFQMRGRDFAVRIFLNIRWRNIVRFRVTRHDGRNFKGSSMCSCEESRQRDFSRLVDSFPCRRPPSGCLKVGESVPLGTPPDGIFEGWSMCAREEHREQDF